MDKQKKETSRSRSLFANMITLNFSVVSCEMKQKKNQT